MSDTPVPGSTAAAAVLEAAARVTGAVAHEGRTLEAALEGVRVDAGLRSAVRAVASGAVRWFLPLRALARLLLEDKVLSPPLRMLLVVALHQLEHSRNPPAATVSAAVDATRRLGQPRAAGMINALLRRYLREREQLRSRLPTGGEACTAHPDWLTRELRAAFPRHWQQVIEADNAHPPMTLRIDPGRIGREDYLELLRERGLGARATAWLPTAVVLDDPVPVARLPGFEQGWVSVQDAGAQLAAALLAPRPGDRVLDACAAPGGKSGALLEWTGGEIDLTAVELDPRRLERVRENLQRLRRPARLVAADLREEPRWWDGQPFDRILLDAPCSGTGVLRRHPDIRLLRRATDIDGLARTQRELLMRCLALLAPEGRLIYSTCSLLPAENAGVVATVLAAHPGARSVPLDLPGQLPAAVTDSWGVQLLPSDQAPSDGFYYACLTVTGAQQRRLT